jgi:hypothetical protein
MQVLPERQVMVVHLRRLGDCLCEEMGAVGDYLCGEKAVVEDYLCEEMEVVGDYPCVEMVVVGLKVFSLALYPSTDL